MRAVIQRVKQAELRVDEIRYSRISDGLLVLVGIEMEDNLEDIRWLSQKISNMRIFSDEQGKMNLSIKDVQGELMIVSQFTLHASTKKGNRPSFIKAANADAAKELYEAFVNRIQQYSQSEVKTGKFGAMMDIELINSGPVTIFMDSKNKE